MTHQLGDAPIQTEYRAQMEAVVRGLDKIFNGDLRGNDRQTGFVLLVFPFGEKEGRCNFVSNGAATFRVEAKDTNGQRFRQEWPATEM